MINTSLTGKPLIHCINSSDSKKCIVGAELASSLEDVLDDINISNKSDIYWVKDGDKFLCPDWASNLKLLLDDSKIENLDMTDMVTAKDTAFYIFTSGTTGVPKAALFPNSKIIVFILDRISLIDKSGESSIKSGNFDMIFRDKLITKKWGKWRVVLFRNKAFYTFY